MCSHKILLNNLKREILFKVDYSIRTCKNYYFYWNNQQKLNLGAISHRIFCLYEYFPYICTRIQTNNHSGCSTVRLVCLLWEQEVRGSNPRTPTKHQHFNADVFLCLIISTFIFSLNKKHHIYFQSHTIRFDFHDLIVQSHIIGFDFHDLIVQSYIIGFDLYDFFVESRIMGFEF